MYKAITNSCEPKIIGVNNGVYQVKIDEKDLKKQKRIFPEIDYLLTQMNFDQFISNRHELFDLQINLKGKLLKKAKVTDIMGYTPYFFGFQYLVSQNFVDCLIDERVSRDEYHLLKVNIEKVNINYYLFYVPWIMNTEIIFSESLIYPSIDKLSKEKKYFNVNNYSEYNKLQTTNPINSFEKVTLNEKYRTKKIISIQGISSLFFSDSLVNRILSEGISSFEFKEKSILSFRDQ